MMISNFHKFCFTAFLSLMSLNAMAIPPSYTGFDLPGTVDIWNTSASTFMRGTLNVRYLPAAGHEKSWILTAQNVPANIVSFIGFDAVNNTSFACLIDPGNPLYDDAKLIANSASDGSFLIVGKPVNSNNCNLIHASKRSYYLH